MVDPNIKVDLIRHSLVHLADEAHPQDHQMIHFIKIKLQKKNSINFTHNIRKVNIKALISEMIQILKINTASIKTSTKHNNKPGQMLIINNTKVRVLHSRISMLNKRINKMDSINNSGGTKEIRQVKLNMQNGKMYSSRRWVITLVGITLMLSSRVRRVRISGINLRSIRRGLRKKRRHIKSMSQQRIVRFIQIIEVIIKKIYLVGMYGLTCGHILRALRHLR